MVDDVAELSQCGRDAPIAIASLVVIKDCTNGRLDVSMANGQGLCLALVVERAVRQACYGQQDGQRMLRPQFEHDPGFFGRIDFFTPTKAFAFFRYATSARRRSISLSNSSRVAELGVSRGGGVGAGSVGMTRRSPRGRSPRGRGANASAPLAWYSCSQRDTVLLPRIPYSAVACADDRSSRCICCSTWSLNSAL